MIWAMSRLYWGTLWFLGSLLGLGLAFLIDPAGIAEWWRR